MKSNKYFELELHKCFDNYLGRIQIPDEETKKPGKKANANSMKPKFIIILDVSGSMGIQVPRLIKRIIPEVFNRIYGNYSSEKITLITFSSFGDVNVYEGKSSYISNLDLEANGCTYMAGAVEKLQEILKNNTSKKILRLLSISDGELHDQEETMKSAEKLKIFLQTEKKIINSQAIRLITGGSDPDTRGLSSLLQLSNKGKQMLVDIKISKTDQEIINDICYLYHDDGLNFSYILKSKENIFQEEPWMPKLNNISLFPGINSFWIDINKSKDEIYKEIQNKMQLFIDNGEEINILFTIKDELSEGNYQDLIKDKIDFYFKQLKILKIVNTEESLAEMDKIISFFNELEESFFAKNTKNAQFKNVSNLKLYERAQILKMVIKRRQTSLSNKMREIRNDNKINTLNSKQQAEYLRNLQINDKTGKSLAKRAIEGGIDFDETARKEVVEIYNHRNELNDVDESKLTNSFYSVCNTLDGIKAVCKLYEDAKKDNIFEEITANDILKIINIVGVAGYNEIGNFPRSYDL